MEYYCHVWAIACSCYLDMLDKLQKRVCRTVSPTVATPLEPWDIEEMQPAEVLSVDMTLVHVCI